MTPAGLGRSLRPSGMLRKEATHRPARAMINLARAMINLVRAMITLVRAMINLARAMISPA